MVRSKPKNFLSTSLLLSLSVLISLGIGELFVRMIVDPVDYLEVYLVDDDILGHKVRPDSLGYDAWGFRNRFVPATARIVTIGDSQTYGTSTTSGDSWPAKLQTLRNEAVYNMSLGGYGPVQYHHLLYRKVPQLKPTVVIVGFYFGNDLFDAYNIVYTKEYWKHLRRPGIHGEPLRAINQSEPVQARKFLGSVRDWLAHHSTSYRMFTLAFGGILRFFEIKYGYAQDNPQLSILDDQKHKIRAGFTPLTRLSVLNLDDPRVMEGLRLTLELFRQMNDVCSKNDIAFVVALIPTKESVFADYIGNNPNIRNAKVIDQVISKERQINQLVKKYLDEHQILYIDLLPALQQAVPVKRIYPQSEDGHPNKEGYEVIAKAIQRLLVNFNRHERNAQPTEPVTRLRSIEVNAIA